MEQRLMSSRRLVQVQLLLLLELFLIHDAQAAIDDCVSRPVTFSGVAPLHFFTASPEVGERLYLHSTYPSSCTSKAERTCLASKYITTGDIVAVGKTCGDWAFVQYIGNRTVSLGWVANSALQRLSTTPEPPKPPAVPDGQPFRTQPRFELKKGHGVPVCEAYLQRLNVTVYQDPPYCGRPETDTVPGFSVFDRIPLDSEEVVRMSGPLFERWMRPNPLLSSSWQVGSGGARGINAWRYKSPVDIANDGNPVPILVWRGYGLSGGAACGVPAGTRSRAGYRPRQLPLVLQLDHQSIDEERTAAIFSGLGRPAWLEGYSWVPASSIFPFRPLGRSIGIFEYRGIVYLDTFFDLSGDAQGKRAGQPNMENTLGVFVRKKQKTEQVCELRMDGTDVPSSDDIG